MKSYLVLAGTRGASALAQMYLIFFLAASSEASEFGLVMGVFAALSVIAALSDFGLGTYTLRAAARNRIDTAAGGAKLATRISGLIGLTAFLGLAIAGVTDSSYAVLTPLAIWAVTERDTETRNMLQLALGQVHRVGILVAGRRIAAVPIMMLLCTWHSPMLAFSSALALSSFVAWCLSLLWTRKWTSGIAVAPFRLIWEQRNLAATGVSGQLRNLDVALIGATAGTAVAGIYGLGTRIGAPLLIIYNAVSNLLLANAYRKSNGSFMEKPLGLWIVSLSIAVASPLLMPPMGSILLPLIEWLESGDLLTIGILLSMTTFIGLGIVLSSILVSADEERHVARNSIFWAVITLLMVVLFSVLNGPLAASVAAAVGYLAKCITLQNRISSLRKKHE